jgi:hypothetical protein
LLNLGKQIMQRRYKYRNLGKARTRLGGLKSIAPTQDFGNGLTTDALASLVAKTEAAISSYNQLFGELTLARRLVQQLEKDLGDMSDRILKAVAAYYGTNSNEYAIVGGVPKQERKHIRRADNEPDAPVEETTAETLPPTQS